MSLIERQTAVYSAIRNALGPYAPDITGTAFGEPILRNATAGAIAAMKPQLEVMQAEIDRLREALGAAWPVVAEMTGTEWAGVGNFKSWQEADNSLRAIKAKVRASLDRQGK